MKLASTILPRFSLRLLLVAVTAFCANLAWERSTVMERQTAKREWNAAGALLLTPEMAAAWPILTRSKKEQARVSFVRRWLADEPIQLELDADSAASLFPEAETFRGGYVF